MIDLRLRTVVGEAELDAKVGKIVTEGDYNVLFTGPARIRRPDGPVLAVFLPGVLRDAMEAVYEVLTRIRITTSNRGLASGTDRRQRGEQKRSYARSIESAIIGAIDAKSAASKVAARMMACRLTAWTGTHLPEWESLQPLLSQIGDHLREEVPDRYEAQARAAAATHPDWVVPGTPFTTVTVNNTYSTGVHQDAGDLEAGFSTLAVCRRGDYQGGRLVLPRYRVAFEMGDGDLLLFDAHEWHGNTAIRCAHAEGPLARACPEGCERISLVTYFRTRMMECGSAAEEADKAVAYVDQWSEGQETPRRA